MFSFLNTWFLLGLAGVAIPILIHLFARKKRIKVDFSSIRFLKNIEIKNIRHVKWIRNLLLILRCLALFFIILAFARPVWNNVQGFGSANSRKNIALILDHSLSMQRDQLFDELKVNAKQLTEYYHVNNNINVFWDPPKPEFFDLSKNWQKSLSSEPVSWQENNTSASLKNVFDWFDKQRDNPNQIIYISDLQSLQTSNIDTVLSRIKCPLIILPITDSLSNVSIVDGGLETTIIQPGHPIDMFVKVVNHSQHSVDDMIMRVFLKDKTVLQQSISLQLEEIQIIHFQIQNPGNGLQWGRVTLSEDAFPQDNTWYFQFKVPEKIDVELMTSLEIQDKIKATLSPKQDNYSIFNIHSHQIVTPDNLNKMDVLVINSTEKFNDLTYSFLVTFIENGGGILLFLDSNIDIRQLSNKVLQPVFNFSIQNMVQARQLNQNAYFSFNQIDWQHPIFNDLLETQAKKIRSPYFYRIFSIPQKLEAPVISYQDNIPCLIDLKIGNGRMLLFNGGLHPEWSNMTYSTLFAPLVNRIIFYLSNQNMRQNESSFIGAPIELLVSNYTAGGQFTVESPDGGLSYIVPSWQENKIYLKSDAADQPGHYFFYNNGQLIGSQYVNISKSESDFYIDWEASPLQNDWIHFLDPKQDIVEQIEMLNKGLELNRLFLILGLILLLLEMILVKIHKK